MQVEHFDDMLTDTSVQSSWAGLDSYLIDDDFLLLEPEEADKIYAELKKRQLRRSNMEEKEQVLLDRMKELEAIAHQNQQSNLDKTQINDMTPSAETIKQYIKNFNSNDKLDFVQRLMNFANIIEQRYLVEGLIMSLNSLTKENSDIKMALLDQFIPLIQLIQEKCTQHE